MVTTDGQLLALDCKMTFDDNAMFRRPNVSELRDYAEEDPREAQAAEYGLNYVALDGNIGCIINGAGLAMATMDMIKHAGGAPANFLDVGGGASPDRVAAAFKLVLSDDNIQAMLVNIFAGINRCDWVAQGVVQATRETQLTIPLVVRLAGTNVEEGRRILKESGLPIITADTLCGSRRAGRRRAQARRPVHRQGTGTHEHPDRRKDPGHRPGLHRGQGDVPRPGDDRVRHQRRRRGDAGQGRRPASGPPGLQHGEGGGARGRRRRQHHLRAGGVLRRLHHGGGGRGNPVRRAPSPTESPRRT